MLTPTPEIRQAFYRRLLENLPFLGVTEADVAWANASFRPQPERVYIAPYCLFAETRIASLSQAGFEEISGIFQINIYGVAGAGEGWLDELAQGFTDMFRGGTFLEIPCWQPVAIRRAWRSTLHFDSGEKGVGRPWVNISSDWHQFTAKGD